ncbi:5-oxoprolinase subunit PxpA [Thalassotalea profundi]|uniref:5-oxoprolinase subunit PxpA n=1 Tax=Thalassotalea profundi TaxID=2036687 RepID=UPI001E2B3466|nr:5-oxoprolinase subunit PxpA [Thalassotalea profundi]
MKLNCDLGESFGSWEKGLDELAMQDIDQANIACGFHAGDPLVMFKTLLLAKKNKVEVGAHPGYPDLVGFGRRSIKCSAQEIESMMIYQISAIDGMAKSMDINVEYVKPHGALYNDMMADKTTRLAVMKATASYHKPLKLMIQATADYKTHQDEAKQLGLTLLAEGFADRRYDDTGRLLSRNEVGAVLNQEQMLEQVNQLKETGTITTTSGLRLPLALDSLCVHGDNIAGVEAIKAIRQILQG